MTTEAINWNVSREDADTIAAIARRAVQAFGGYGITQGDTVMDITAVHANGCPLRLAELLEAEPFDFAHDIGGIRNHLNRETGRLEDFFLPRYAAKVDKETAAIRWAAGRAAPVDPLPPENPA